MLGFAIVGASSEPPDSITRTCAPEVDNSAARTEPAAPAPTTMKSYRSCTFAALVIFKPLVTSERVLPLTAVRIDPDHVAEIIQAVGARAAPAAVADAAHRRVDLVVDGWRIHVHDAGEHLRRHVEGSVGVSGKNRGRQPVHRSIRGSDGFLGCRDCFDHDDWPQRLLVGDGGI